MSKRPLPGTSTSEPRKKSSFRFARDPSKVVANSAKVGQLASGRIKQTKQNIPLASSSSAIDGQEVPLPQDPSQPLQLDDLNSTDAIQVEQDIASDVLSPRPKRKKRTNTTSVSMSNTVTLCSSYLNYLQSRLTEWLKYRDSTLHELLRLYGLGEYGGSITPSCCPCGESNPTTDSYFRCLDCFSQQNLRCKSCMIKAHHFNPLHRIEVHICSVSLHNFLIYSESFQRWNGTYFEKTTLRNVGLTIQLNHTNESCPLPVKGPADFLVFDSTGIHRVSINFCGCRKSTRDNITRRIQLLRNRWFPATSEQPKTVFTFSVLKIFHQLTLQSKISIYDYYHTILRLTDPYELEKMTVCC